MPPVKLWELWIPRLLRKVCGKPKSHQYGNLGMIDFSGHQVIGTYSTMIGDNPARTDVSRLFPQQPAFVWQNARISLFCLNNTKVYTTNRNRHAQKQMADFFVEPVMNFEQGPSSMN